MSVLPDQERRTRYQPSVPTSAFNINFTLFSDDDVAVFHDGVEVEEDGNWSVEASYVNGEATSARVLTEDPAGWSGVTIDIVGRRRPRRTSQYADGRGVPAKDLNLDFNSMAASLREAYDRTLRTVRVPPSETLNVLPTAEDRAGMVLAFDSDGQPISSDLIGERGWSPVYVIVSDGARRVHKLIGYVGGEGDEPTDNVEDYVGASGYVSDIADAVDIRGPAGASGAGTGDMLAENNLSDVDDVGTARDNLGLGDSATRDVGTGSGDVSAGDHNHDSRYYTEAEVDAAIAAALAASGGRVYFRLYTASDTWTKPTGLVKLWVFGVGSGGGGGSVDTGSNTRGGGGGPGGRGFVEKLAASLGSTETITINNAGAGAPDVNAATDGSDGGSVSFGAHLVCNGGKKGRGASAGAQGAAGAAGTVTGTGAVTLPALTGDFFSLAWVGGFVAGLFGGGPPSYTRGASAVGFGGGGNGSDRDTSGGDGSKGCIFVIEFY